MNIEQHAAFRDKAQQSSLIKIELIGSPPPNQQIIPLYGRSPPPQTTQPGRWAGQVGARVRARGGVARTRGDRHQVGCKGSVCVWPLQASAFMAPNHTDSPRF